MVHEFYLEAKLNSWRPEYVRNERNFSNRINHFRQKWKSVRHKPNDNKEKIKVITNFNNEYSAWLTKVRKANAERRKKERNFFNKITTAKRQGPNAVERVLAEYNVSPPKRQSTPVVPRRSSSVAKRSPPKRSGKPRNTGNLRRNIAQRNLTQLRNSLFTELRALEAKRNNLEREINRVVKNIGKLPVPRS